MKIALDAKAPPHPALRATLIPLKGGEGLKSEFASRGGRGAGGEGWSVFSSQVMRRRRMMSVKKFAATDQRR